MGQHPEELEIEGEEEKSRGLNDDDAEAREQSSW